MSDGEFAATIGPLCDALADYTGHAQRLIAPRAQYIAGSVAHAEAVDEPRFTEDVWPEPVRTAHLHAGLLTYFLAEHVSSIATLIPNASIGPAYAHWTLLRPVVDVVSVVTWMNDAEVGTETRIRRCIALRRKSIAKQLEIPDEPDLHASLELEREQLAEYERRRGITTRESIPQAKQDLTNRIGGPRDVVASTAIWKLASASIHGDIWALAGPLVDAPQPNPGGPPIGGVAVTVSNCAQVVAVAALALRAAVNARVAFTGNTVDRDYARSMEAVEDLVMPLLPPGPS